MTRALGVCLLSILLGMAPAGAAAQVVTVGAGVGLSSGPFRVFDWYEGTYARDAAFDVTVGRAVKGPFEVYARVGFSALGSVAVEDCSGSCHEATRYSGTVLTAGLGGGLRLTPAITARLGVGLAKFVGLVAGDDYLLLLPSGGFNPMMLGQSPATVGVEGGARWGVTDRWGLEIVDLFSLQAGPSGEGATHRVRLLVSWVASR